MNGAFVGCVYLLKSNTLVRTDKSVAESEQSHAEETKEDTQVATVVEAQTLHEQLQRYTNHDARCNSKEAGVSNRTGLHVCSIGNLEPKCSNASADRLRETTKEG